MTTRQILYADEGKVLTNGEAYGKILYLAIDEDPNNWYEITEEEYNEIVNEENENNSNIE